MRFKKLMAAGLALAMAAMPMFGSMAAYADTVKTAAVTVTGSESATYTAYKLLDATTYVSAGSTTYTYTVNNTFRAAIVAGINATGKATLANDASDDDIIAALEKLTGGQTGTIDFGSYSSSDMYKFGHAVSEAIANLSLNAGDSFTSAAGGEFTNIPYGYYLIKETADSDKATGEESDYIIATAVTQDQEIARKIDTVPTIEKKIDGTKDAETFQIGDSVDFTITADVPSLHSKYVVTDLMGQGLKGISNVVVKVNGTEINTATIKYMDINDKEVAADEAIQLEVSIPEASLVTGEDMVVITYSAVLTSDSVVIGNAGNNNFVELEYSNDPKDTASTDVTETDQNKAYTLQLDVTKWATVDGVKTVLANAQFTLKDDQGNVVKFTQDQTDVEKYTVDAEGSETLTTGNNGKIKLVGLGEGTYTLNETKAPDGFKLDAADYTIVITSTEPTEVKTGNETLTALTATITHNGSDSTATTDAAAGHLAFEVENKSGQLLPSTGGMGTYLFYGAGIVIMAGIAGSFIVRRRED